MQGSISAVHRYQKYGFFDDADKKYEAMFLSSHFNRRRINRTWVISSAFIFANL